MATPRRDSHADEDTLNGRSPTSIEKTVMVATESERQNGLEETPLQKPQVSEPCMATMENYLLAHFFFIFAASFILGVIFLHSSLSFWSWQVYDEVPPFGSEQQLEVQETFPYNSGSSNEYGHGLEKSKDILNAVISPNMTVSFAR